MKFRSTMSRLLAGRLTGPATIVLIGYVGFVALARGSYELATDAGAAAAFWPSNGLIVALCLLLPARRRPWALAAILPGELTSDLLQSYPVLTSLGWAAANVVETSLAAWIVIRIAGGPPRGDSGRNYIALAIGSAAAPMVGGVIGAAVWVASFGGGFGATWLSWWLGDATGILLISSLVFAFAQPVPKSDLRGRIALVLELVLVLAPAAVVFTLSRQPLEFVVIPPVILLAQRQVPRWTALSSLSFAIVAAVCTGHGLGPLSAMTTSYRVLAVQMFVSTTAFVGFAICGTMSERRAAEAELARLVGHDHLTGIANRRAFLSRLDDLVRATPRRLAPAATLRNLVSATPRDLAVAYFDLDGFKQINDTYGHSVGDLVLSEVGRRLTETVRAGDLAARLGGDEFAVVLDPVADFDDASRAAARLAAAIAAPVRLNDVEVPIAVSVGVSLLADDIEAALGAADHRLYAHKAARRGRQNPEVTNHEVPNRLLPSLP